MLSLVFLVSVAAASPLIRILPLYEDTVSQYPAEHHADAWCVYDCHHHILHKPVFIVGRWVEGHYSVHYSPLGLNALTLPIHDFLSAEHRVAVLFPYERFPFELFPGLLEAEIHIPEHLGTLGHYYHKAPVLAVFSEDEFLKFNERRGYHQLADLGIDEKGFSVLKDYAQYNRLPSYHGTRDTPSVSHEHTSGVTYLVPSSNPLFTPTYNAISKDTVRLSTSESYRVIPVPVPDPNYYRGYSSIRIE